MQMIKNPICIDFDGVIAKYEGWKGEDHYGEPIEGAKEFLEKMQSVGLKFIIFTTRDIKKVNDWFKKYKLAKPHKITNIKVPSPLYIDDRCIRFNGNFNELLEDIKDFN